MSLQCRVRYFLTLDFALGGHHSRADHTGSVHGGEDSFREHFWWLIKCYLVSVLLPCYCWWGNSRGRCDAWSRICGASILMERKRERKNWWQESPHTTFLSLPTLSCGPRLLLELPKFSRYVNYHLEATVITSLTNICCILQPTARLTSSLTSVFSSNRISLYRDLYKFYCLMCLITRSLFALLIQINFLH